MTEHSSNTTLLTIGKVAEVANVSRPTLYSWIEAGLVTPRYEVEGPNSEPTPVFTKQECADVARLAREREEHRTQLRLSTTA